MHVKAVCLVVHPRSRLMIDHGRGLSVTIRVGMLLVLTANGSRYADLCSSRGMCALSMFSRDLSQYDKLAEAVRFKSAQQKCICGCMWNPHCGCPEHAHDWIPIFQHCRRQSAFCLCKFQTRCMLQPTYTIGLVKCMDTLQHVIGYYEWLFPCTVAHQ